MFFSTIWAYFMPNVNNSVYFHNEKSEPTDVPPPTIKNYTSSTGEPKTTEDIESQQSKTKVGNKIEYKTLYIYIYYIVRRAPSICHTYYNKWVLLVACLMIILKKNI